MITSGSVFVFDEDESGIKRWTDGFFWSPSRILGNFLLYRETEKRGAGHRSARSEQAVVTDVNEQSQYNVEGVKLEGQTLSRPKSESNRLGIDRQRERSLVGSLTNSYKFKPGGMMKKTFSLTIGGVAQHLISYYKIEDVEQGRLRSPSTLPELASLNISPEYLDKTHFRNPPKVDIGVDGLPRYVGEADDVDLSPRLLPAPLSSGLPYYPDATGTPAKRSRKKNSSTQQDAASGEAQALSVSVQQPQPGYPDASGSSPTAPLPPYAPYNYYSYPVPHMYSPGPYPPPPGGAPAPASTPPQQSPSPPQLTYPGYPPAPGEASQPSPAMYAQYYPPPPHGYAAYPGWPHYSGYPPPQAPPPPPSGADGSGAQAGEGGTGGNNA
ncbi:Global transcription regulator sge1 [Grifola frondosa]|uniref:Global transcription regulator sge1 n=1 Tax=Grifola frondosa TaxID=5627 RepID=A0A1C7M9H3_GRIFR|nr:Global transcription regulator sge1 [Grifola frondosa]